MIYVRLTRVGPIRGASHQRPWRVRLTGPARDSWTRLRTWHLWAYSARRCWALRLVIGRHP
jgi:hypothetical protein